MHDGDDFPELPRSFILFQDGRITGKVRAVPGAGSNRSLSRLLGSSERDSLHSWSLALPFTSRSLFAGEYASRTRALSPELCPDRTDSLPNPYAMVALNVFAADTMAEARKARYIAAPIVPLIAVRGSREDKTTRSTIWTRSGHRKKRDGGFTVGRFIIGDPEIVRLGLESFLERTQADELMINGIFYDHAARFRSYEIVADVWKN